MTSHFTPRRAASRSTHRYLPALVVLVFVGGGCGATGAAAAKPQGSLRGEMIMEGGATGNAGPRPVPGTIEIISGGRRVATAVVGASGVFSAAVPAGSYRVEATTPMIETASAGGFREGECAAPVAAQVSADATTAVTVVCVVP